MLESQSQKIKRCSIKYNTHKLLSFLFIYLLETSRGPLKCTQSDFKRTTRPRDGMRWIGLAEMAWSTLPSIGHLLASLPTRVVISLMRIFFKSLNVQSSAKSSCKRNRKTYESQASNHIESAFSLNYSDRRFVRLKILEAFNGRSSVHDGGEDELQFLPKIHELFW